MLIHCRATPSIKFAGNHLYTLGGQKQYQSVQVLPKSTTQTSTQGSNPGLEPKVKRTNHQATTPTIIPDLDRTAKKFNNYSTLLLSRYCLVEKVVFRQCLCLYCQQHCRHQLPGRVRIHCVKMLLEQACRFFKKFKKILFRFRSRWSYL